MGCVGRVRAGRVVRSGGLMSLRFWLVRVVSLVGHGFR